jgi:hypothetical protein
LKSPHFFSFKTLNTHRLCCCTFLNDTEVFNSSSTLVHVLSLPTEVLSKIKQHPFSFVASCVWQAMAPLPLLPE